MACSAAPWLFGFFALPTMDAPWSTGLHGLRAAFWLFNIGLSLMALLTLLPLGVLQLTAALEHGYWFARSAEFMGRPIIHLLIWLRVPGDTLFACGALAFAWFVFRLWVAPRPAAVLPDAVPAGGTA